MRLLLDTQVWLWLQTTPERISRATSKRIADPEAELLLSTASAWEIAIKYGLGKLPLPVPPEEYVPSRLRMSKTEPLAIRLDHVLRVATLPHKHRDPFDRLIVAQAKLEGLPIVTADAVFGEYEVEIVRA